MSLLERITHVSLIAVSLVSLGLLLEKRFQPPPQPSRATEMVGKRWDLPGVAWSRYARHIVLFISPTCHFCLSSMPFYRQLSETYAQQNQVELLVVSNADIKELKELLTREHVSVKGIFQIQQRKELRGTPTLLIVNNNGIVNKVYEGMLPLTDQRQVLETAQALNRSRNHRPRRCELYHRYLLQ